MNRNVQRGHWYRDRLVRRTRAGLFAAALLPSLAPPDTVAAAKVKKVIGA